MDHSQYSENPASTVETAEPSAAAQTASQSDFAGKRSSCKSHSSIWHMAGSTLVSMLMVLGLLVAARLVVPTLVEDIRYRWYRGQLRAEHELSSERLQNVSLDSLTDVSQMVSRRLGPSVVRINTLRDQQALGQYERFLGSSNPALRYEGQGSGFVIDAEGLILTNYHVIAGAEQRNLAQVNKIEATLADGRQLAAEIVGVDPKTDLAVLKVAATDLIAVEWGDSDTVVIGTPVWAVGSPYGLQQTITFGIISGKHRIDLSGTRYQDVLSPEPAYGDLMQSDVAVNPGNSGGPLVNAVGQVVGVNAAILGESYRGISFSIPSRVARRVVNHLIESGEVQRGWLGVRMQDLAYDQRYGADGQMRPGVRIVEFPKSEPSPAQQAGLKEDDVIVEFQGKPVLSQVSLINMIGEAEVGTTAEVVVQRQNQFVRVQVTLGKRSLKL
ncbi:MAG: trypsin-like peptidase domain-containing protein [Pirellulaceae bacterium]|nr:trypsin-like peptidase domain-containing protein [Pirellulaceae bacterium]